MKTIILGFMLVFIFFGLRFIWNVLKNFTNIFGDFFDDNNDGFHK